MKPAFGLATPRILAAAIVLLLIAGGTTTEAQATAPALKSAFLYNFAQFTEWPSDVDIAGPLTICVLGDAAVAAALRGTVQGRSIDGREVAVSHVEADGLHGCDVLYLTGLDSKRSQQILDEVKGEPVLTVSDRDQFAQTGGMIGLFVENDRMRFAINVEAAARARLRISSRLLSLATIVKDGHVR